MDLFLEGAPDRISKISQSVSEPAMMAFHAHSLKSMGLNLGARRVVDLAQRLEDIGRNGDVESVASVLEELQVAYSQTRNRLLEIRGT